MSELSRQARRAMRAKIHRITKGGSGKVDASDYGPEEVLDAGVKTGMRPISRRAFKKGGKVVANEGKEAVKHAGKKPRKSGNAPLSINAIVNRNVKDANEDREGKKHIGGFKRGGKIKKEGGGPLSSMGGDLYGLKSNPNPNRVTMLKKGGKACKDGGGPVVRADSPPSQPVTGSKAAQQQAMMEAIAKRMQSKDPTNIPPPPPPADQIIPGRRKSGGRAKFEGTAKDVREDKKLAKKHHMSMKDWEASEMDRKHDKQRSMKGLKTGGLAADGEIQGTRPTGGRLARKSGGGNWIAGAIKHPGSLRKALHVKEGHDIPAGKLEKAEHSSNPKLAKKARLAETLKRINKKSGGDVSGLELASGGRAKGKTNINIVIGTGPKPAMPMAPGMPQPPAGGIPVAVPPGAAPAAAPAAAAPAPMPMPMPSPAMGGGLGGAGASPLGRKRGGRTYRSYKDMDAGAGSGEGRLEKTEIQKHKK